MNKEIEIAELKKHIELLSKKVNKIKTTIAEKEKKKRPFSTIEVNREKCVLCGKCSDVCPVEAIRVDNEIHINNDLCRLCGRCIEECPTQALFITHNNGGNYKMPRFNGTGPSGQGPGTGRGAGRGGGRGRMGGTGMGSVGYCICSQCGKRVSHQRGMPCTSRKCPDCGSVLTREV